MTSSCTGMGYSYPISSMARRISSDTPNSSNVFKLFLSLRKVAGVQIYYIILSNTLYFLRKRVFHHGSFIEGRTEKWVESRSGFEETNLWKWRKEHGELRDWRDKTKNTLRSKTDNAQAIFEWPWWHKFSEQPNERGFARKRAFSPFSSYTFFKGYIHSLQTLHKTGLHFDNQQG